MTALSTAEERRLDTWSPEIAEALYHDPAPWDDQGDERHFPGHGGLNINKRTGAWWAHGAGIGGWHVLGLIAFLKNCQWWEAIDWGIAWLASHAGTGSALGHDDDSDVSETKRQASAFRAQEILDNAVAAEGTIAETYLRSRALDPPYPNCVKFIEHGRVGESALVGVLRAHDRDVGAQLLYLDPFGRKSAVQPQRQRFNIETAPGALFEVQPETAVTDLQFDLLICEGIEDVLSVAKLGRHWHIVGAPGVGTIRKMSVKKGARVLIVRDGDAPGSPSDKALAAGIDHLILDCEAAVKVTATPQSVDANSILQSDPSLAELNKLVASATVAQLSREGEFARIARMPQLDRGPEVRAISKRFDIPIDDVRKEVAKLEPKSPGAADDTEEEAGQGFPEDEPWTGPLPALAILLNRIAAELDRYLVMTKAQIIAVTLWVAASHLVHSTHIRLPIFAKLAIESKDPESGKTTLLMLVWNMVPRGQLYSRTTGPYLVREIDANRPTPCLDEVQHYTDPVVLNVIDASHLRSAAYIGILVLDKNGNYVPKRFCVWGPIAMARLGEFSPAQQSRSIVIWMRPKLPGETRAHLVDGTAEALVELRRQLAAWAATVTSWARPTLPKPLINWTGDNWMPLLFVADMAGGDWPQSGREAAEELMKIERQPTITQRLLSSIWKIYQPTPEDDPEPFISSKDLRAKLIADPEEDWDGVNRGKEITYQWLRDRLAHLLIPPGSQSEYYTDSTGVRRHRHGYAFTQFNDAFARYVGDHPLSHPSQVPRKGSGSCGSSGSSPGNPSESAAPSEPDGAPDEPSPSAHPVQDESSETTKKSTSAPDEPGEPDDLEHLGKDTHTSEARPASDSGSPTEPEKRAEIREGLKAFADAYGFDPPALAAILACRKEHSDWSAEKIRKALGLKKSVVEQVLNDQILREWRLV
jgi:putative DNA primase/helicase